MKQKIISISLVFIALIFAFCINIKAIDITTDSSKAGSTDKNSYLITNKGDLKVTGVNAGDTLTAYKVLDAYYNSSTNVITYEFTSDFKKFLASSSTYQNLTVDEYSKLTSGSITDGSTTTTSTLDKLASAYASYVKTNSVSGTNMSTSGTTASLNTAAGAYLILPSVTNRVYAVMVGNIDFSASNNVWNINNETIVAKVSDAGVTKSVSDGTHKEASFNIGDEFSYTIVGTVPQYPTNAINKTYIIKDTLSAGLTFSGINKVEIKDGETALTVASDGTVTNASGKTVATIVNEGQNLTINFNLDNVTSNRVTVTYKVTLNSNAIIGGAGNSNEATLEYSNDPYSNGTHETDPGDGKTNVYTYGIELIKKSEDGQTLLNGAEFEVYSDAELKNKVGTITTGDDGKGTIKGLKEGVYYLKETRAPAGYKLLDVAKAINVSPTEGTAGSIEGYFQIEITNDEMGLLPVTGGIGTLVYILMGLTVVAIAIVAFVIYRKKNKLAK